ncbi:MAG: hypothetical protein GEU93_07385 [Propionibacteriales bacterium]|nr:hypothetical protein [Propionibacteriales bacterium]
MTRRLVSALAVIALPFVILVAVPAPAQACGVGSSEPCTTVQAETQNTGYYSIGGTSCSAYVSSTAFGGGCASRGGWECQAPNPADCVPPTWREIINEHGGIRRFDPCRVDRIPDGFRHPPPLDDDPDKEWLIQFCMDGYDLDDPDGGAKITLQIRRVWEEYEEEPPWMWEIWGDVSEGQGTFPFPLLDFGPQTPDPIVGTPTFFWASFQRLQSDGTPEPVGEPFVVPIGTDFNSGDPVYVIAQLANLRIEPGEISDVTGDPHEINCEREYKHEFVAGENDIETFDDTCSWVYQHSSAGQPDGYYTTTARATWRVGYHIGEIAQGEKPPPPKPLNGESLSIVTTRMEHEIRVREVQVRDQVFE